MPLHTVVFLGSVYMLFIWPTMPVSKEAATGFVLLFSIYSHKMYLSFTSKEDFTLSLKG